MTFDFIRFAIRYTFRVHIFICSAHSSYVNSLFLSLNNSNSSFEKFASCNMFCISIDVNRIGFIYLPFFLNIAGIAFFPADFFAAGFAVAGFAALDLATLVFVLVTVIFAIAYVSFTVYIVRISRTLRIYCC